MLPLLFALIFKAQVHADVIPTCGKMVNALLTLDPKKETAVIDGAKETEEEFCDNNIEELFSNFDIQFLDINKKVINTQSLYVNTFTVTEGSVSKKEMQFGKTKFLEDPQYRTLRFSIVKDRPKLVGYKVIRRTDKKIFGEGEIK